MSDNALHTAHARYHEKFVNAIYRELIDKVGADLHAERESEKAAEAANLVIDTALEVCGSQAHTGAHIRLAIYCASHAITPATIHAIAEYLYRFEPPWETTAIDFEATAKALLSARAARYHLRDAVTLTSDIHSWQGRMAHELVAASDYLLLAATHSLAQGDPMYIHEKLGFALNRVTLALYEGILNSDAPLFDLSTHRFPTHRSVR
jgi:hypothetical protein